ncbi:hypothetical protein [Streptomyces sp. YS415]|uniref:hypothetical protein n=1 Tax=Streptomyces sp. YS415 TaxID=2944806 RepID=UPI002020441D|nr:hypothetical protein [Streptomyces sp. YS415]MCL7429801.1 hypothetical protein [Streptomyces sp. YS415]
MPSSSWPLQRHKDFDVSYAANARMVALSEREEATKLELLVELTIPVQRQFFALWWTRMRYYMADQRAFTETIARLRPEAPPAS